MTIKPTKRTSGPAGQYDSILEDILNVIDTARRSATRSVNSIMTAAYWIIGRRIVESEQAGNIRADYGLALIVRLSGDLTAKFGRGFGAVNLSQMKKFYLLWPANRIFQTPSEKSRSLLESKDYQAILQTSSKKSQASQADVVLRFTADCFPLPWSAYVRLLSVKNANARRFYETEALRGGWSVRQLDRQINSQFYEWLNR